MWLPYVRNTALNALLIPVRLVVLVYWDIRCQWLGWHHYAPWRRYELDNCGRLYWDCSEVCTNPYCRANKPGSWHRELYRQVGGDGDA